MDSFMTDDHSEDDEVLESPPPTKKRRLDATQDGSSSPLAARWDQSPKTTVTYGRQLSNKRGNRSSLRKTELALVRSSDALPDTPGVDHSKENVDDQNTKETPGPHAEEATTVTPAPRKRGRPRKPVAPQPEIQLSELDGLEDGGQDAIENEGRSTTPTPTTRRSGRERRRSKRLSPQAEEPGIASRSTPAMRGRGRGRARRTTTTPRQNGAMESGESLGFTDIPNGATSTPLRDASADINREGGMVATEQEAAESAPLLKRKPGRPRKDEATPRKASTQWTPQEDEPDVNGDDVAATGREIAEPTLPTKRKPGRPRKNESTPRKNMAQSSPPENTQDAHREDDTAAAVQEPAGPTPPLKRKRGRPRKDDTTPRKTVAQAIEQSTPQEDAAVEEQDGGDTPGSIELHGLFARLTRDFEPAAVVDSVGKAVLEKLTGRRRVPLIGLDEEYRKIHQVVRQTVVAGEGNSLLVVGGRGTGKSTVRPFSSLPSISPY